MTYTGSNTHTVNCYMRVDVLICATYVDTWQCIGDGLCSHMIASSGVGSREPLVVVLKASALCIQTSNAQATYDCFELSIADAALHVSRPHTFLAQTAV